MALGQSWGGGLAVAHFVFEQDAGDEYFCIYLYGVWAGGGPG